MTGDFGFKDIHKKDYSDFKLKIEDAREAVDRENVVDRAAERMGFPSREPTERVKRTPKTNEPMDHAYVRAPVSVINRLKRHCNERGLTYGEALHELMLKAGL